MSRGRFFMNAELKFTTKNSGGPSIWLLGNRGRSELKNTTKNSGGPSILQLGGNSWEQPRVK